MDETTADQPAPNEVLIVAIEEVGPWHPSVNLEVFIETTRVALSRYHRSPASFAMTGQRGTFPASVVFGRPDPRSAHTVERERCVEEGAILFAAFLLADRQTKQITRIVPRGGGADYFLEEPGQPGFWLLEVSGTDEGNVDVRRKLKAQQLRTSHQRKLPGFLGGFVAVTRFAPPATSLLELCDL